MRSWREDELGSLTHPSDLVSSRTLSYLTQVGKQVSDVGCQTVCASLGFTYAGTEYAGRWYPV
jgi:hypothetical protein